MSLIRQKLPYGKKSISFLLDSSRLLGRLETPPVRNNKIESLLARSLLRPIGGVSIDKALCGKKKILIAVTDSTRKTHLSKILPFFINKIDNGKRDISIIVASGLHKWPDAKELRYLLGPGILKKYRVLLHGIQKGDVKRMGMTSMSVPVDLDRNLFNCDIVLSIGTVEPHLYAGYSGGAKTVAIGLAGEETIHQTHGVRFLGDKRTVIGRTDGNPFHKTLWEIASRVKFNFAINLVNDHSAKPAAIFCGEPRRVYKEAVKCARKIFELHVRKESDIVICGIGYPKDINLYQASRAINYIANVKRPILRIGGVLIIAAELQDGIGKSPAEKRFYSSLRSIASPASYLSSVMNRGFTTGEHRAFMVAGPLINYRLIFVSKSDKLNTDGLPFIFKKTISQTLELAERMVGHPSSIYVIPNALSTIANLRE